MSRGYSLQTEEQNFIINCLFGRNVTKYKFKRFSLFPILNTQNLIQLINSYSSRSHFYVYMA
jgi:hypothetical protein